MAPGLSTAVDSISSALRRDLPRVTVVTVVRNQVDEIERTLDSVIGQDYPALEYLVVDGGSADGTLDAIRRVESRLTQWVSGADGGPYGGMNRGAAMATGEWIIFMNGGDRFASNDVVRRVFERSDVRAHDVLYGDAIVDGPGYRALERSADHASLSDGNGFPHQAAFVRTPLQVLHGFDMTERIAADYDFFLKLRRAGASFHHVDVVVCEFFLGGISSLSRGDTLRLRHRVYKKHFARSDAVLYAKLAALSMKIAVRALLPTRLWRAAKRLIHGDRILHLDAGTDR